MFSFQFMLKILSIYFSFFVYEIVCFFIIKYLEKFFHFYLKLAFLVFCEQHYFCMHFMYINIDFFGFKIIFVAISLLLKFVSKFRWRILEFFFYLSTFRG